ncbi:MAG: hypothetical protein K2K24_01520 [Clostridia bacterium]|nr:hypothetical protein [Clostridia bacterium]
MIEEMIDSILDAEDKAKEIIKESVGKSNDIVSDAKKQAKINYEKAKDEQFAKEKEATQKGLADGEKSRIAQLADVQVQIAELGKISDDKRKKVYSEIKKELKAKYGVK